MSTPSAKPRSPTSLVPAIRMATAERWSERRLYRNLTETDRKIIELIFIDKFVTTSQMTTQIGKSRQTIAVRIKELQEKGIVKRNGPDNGGFWEICELE